MTKDRELMERGYDAAIWVIQNNADGLEGEGKRCLLESVVQLQAHKRFALDRVS